MASYVVEDPGEDPSDGPMVVFCRPWCVIAGEEEKKKRKEKKLGGVSQWRVIPGFISAGVLCAPEQCVTTSGAQAGTTGL